MKAMMSVIVALAIVGCTPAQEPPQVRGAQPMPEKTQPTPMVAPGTRAAATIAQLASRLGVAPESISVVEARPVVWGDGSLGCPQPGMMYTQALVPGELIVLEVAGQRYRFHAGTHGEPFECPPGRAQVPTGQSDLVAQ